MHYDFGKFNTGELGEGYTGTCYAVFAAFHKYKIITKDFLKQIPRRNFFSRAAVAWPVLWSFDTLYLLALAPHRQGKKINGKISKLNVYLTMLLSPLYCFSNTLIDKIIDYKKSRIKRLLGNTLG